MEIFKYLGNKIVRNGSVKEEVTERIQIVGRFYHLL
jgi:hypothetical protein